MRSNAKGDRTAKINHLSPANLALACCAKDTRFGRCGHCKREQLTGLVENTHTRERLWLCTLCLWLSHGSWRWVAVNAPEHRKKWHVRLWRWLRRKG